MQVLSITRQALYTVRQTGQDILNIQSIPSQISQMQKEISKKKLLLRQLQSSNSKHTPEDKHRVQINLQGEISVLEQQKKYLLSELDRLSTSLHSSSRK